MVQLRYSPGEVDISGSPQELQKLRKQLIRFLDSDAKELPLELDASFDPTPYAMALPCLQFSKADGPTKISLFSSSRLAIQGSTENIRKFSSWLDVPIDAKPGFHNHFDYIGEDEYVDKASLPTVVGVR